MPQETRDVLLKKIEKIKGLLDDLDQLLSKPFDVYRTDRIPLSAAQRYFELMVELASDINTSLILAKSGQTPDSYREAFSRMSNLGLEPSVVALLVEGARERNILIHEYDFDIDDEKFYDSAKRVVPAFRKYLKFINTYLENFK